MSANEYRWAGDTDPGKVRGNNEDMLFPDGDGAGPGPLLFAVADGLGGLEAGEVASAVAVAAAIAVPADDSTVTVLDRVQAAARAVIERSRQFDPPIASATTLTIARIGDRVLDVGHAGDSRLYMYGSDSLVQVTQDHTVAQQKIDAGLITAEEGLHDPTRHILTSACGVGDLTIQHVSGIELSSGDRILLCSDGLTDMVTDDDLALILGRRFDPATTVQLLIDTANQAGGRDNITAIVVDVIDGDG